MRHEMSRIFDNIRKTLQLYIHVQIDKKRKKKEKRKQNKKGNGDWKALLFRKNIFE